MDSSLHIATASRLLGAHLLASFVRPAWSGPSPALSEGPGGGDAGEALCVWLYHVDGNNAWRNASDAPTRRSPEGVPVAVAPLALDVHYLVSAWSPEQGRAQQILECACLRLHAEPLVPASEPGMRRPLVFTPVSRTPAEFMALWQAMRTAPRPALAYQATVVLEAELPGDAVPPVLRNPSG